MSAAPGVEEGGGFRLRSVVYDALWSPRTELVARCPVLAAGLDGRVATAEAVETAGRACSSPGRRS